MAPDGGCDRGNRCHAAEDARGLGNETGAAHKESETGLHLTPELVGVAPAGDQGSIKHIKTAHKTRDLKFRVQDSRKNAKHGPDRVGV